MYVKNVKKYVDTFHFKNLPLQATGWSCCCCLCFKRFFSFFLFALYGKPPWLFLWFDYLSVYLLLLLFFLCNWCYLNFWSGSWMFLFDKYQNDVGFWLYEVIFSCVKKNTRVLTFLIKWFWSDTWILSLTNLKLSGFS